jgi:hypothetical protein
MSPHPLHGRLTAFVAGECSINEIFAIAEHCGECSTCRNDATLIFEKHGIDLAQPILLPLNLVQIGLNAAARARMKAMTQNYFREFDESERLKTLTNAELVQKLLQQQGSDSPLMLEIATRLDPEWANREAEEKGEET